MSRKTLTSTIAAVMLALGALGAGAGAAAAAGPQAAVTVQFNPYHHGDRNWRHDRGRDRGWRHDRRYRNVCEPREALHKARRMGLHRPGIARINHRAIVVSGYKWRHPARVVFSRRSAHCAVIGRRGF